MVTTYDYEYYILCFVTFTDDNVYRLLQNLQLNNRNRSFQMSFKPNRLCQTTLKTFCGMDMAAGSSDGPKKLSVGYIMDKARSVWDSSPEPVKSFPWDRTLDTFIQLILDLVLAVTKCLALPLFFITSVSEISYCAHERKLFLVPIPFLIGLAVAGVLRNAALETSPFLKVLLFSYYITHVKFAKS